MAPGIDTSGIWEYIFGATLAETPQGAIVITGCDTGFGSLLTYEFASRGWTVYAGCLNHMSVEKFDKIKANNSQFQSINAFVLDVTKDDHIEKAKTMIETAEKDGIYCLINNAGIGEGANVEWCAMETYRKVMDVNFMSMVAMTKTFLPLLRLAVKKRPTNLAPRVINITSVAGRIAPPGMSAYAASKHAGEAFSDALRLEVAPFGIKVIIIEPYFAATNIIPQKDAAKTRIDEIWNSTPLEVQKAYGEHMYQKYRAKFGEILSSPITLDPKDVVNIITSAVRHPVPKRRYLIGAGANIVLAHEVLPTWVLDNLIWLNMRLSNMLPADSVPYFTEGLWY